MAGGISRDLITNSRLSFISSLQCSGISHHFDLHPEAVEYLSDFPTKKVKLSKKLYEYFNQMVFDNKLPHDMVIKWNRRLTSTAGYFKRREKSIHLSDKIIKQQEQLIDTLIHEMCHAAVVFVDRIYGQPPHGSAWRRWCIYARNILPEISGVSVRHDYLNLTEELSQIKL